MFTGIVQAIGELRADHARGGDVELLIAAAGLGLDGVAIGDSISVQRLLSHGDAAARSIRSPPTLRSKRCR